MQQFNKFRGTKGFIVAWQHLLRFRYMITEQAQERCRRLAFWERHGTKAATEAFHISERTLFRWQAALKTSRGKLDGLNPKSTAPRARNQRIVSPQLAQAIIALRFAHPRLGKDKLRPLLLASKHPVSVSTIGRILADLKQAGKLPDPKKLSLSGATGKLLEKKRQKRKKLRRPKGQRVLEVDTVVRFIDGVKRYIVTGIDTETRVAFAACYTNHGSSSASDFLQRAQQVIPDCPEAVQTDNGSEFALHFETACLLLGLTHFHTYPRSPQMNAHIERFNRTLDEEFLCYSKALMRDDVQSFNQKLIDWFLWYNGERPHYALGQVAPLRYMMRLLFAEDCQMWWTHTGACVLARKKLLYLQRENASVFLR